MNVIDQAQGDNWIAYNGDCCDTIRGIPDASVGHSIYSPPFGDLFVYSESERDMGNSADDAEFFQHYRFLIGEMLRVTMPGRLSAVHCTDLPTRKFRDGVIGLRDFSGEIIRAHADAGWIYHSRVTIWKDPVVEMQRTKALGLLHKQLIKDSSMSRAGMPDYLLIFRAPGENAVPVAHARADMPVDLWQKWASPVWMDINQTNVLNVRAAREDRDEKHLCPLQLDVIERSVTLWSNRGDTVLSPFMGIGSEGYVSIKLGRRFVGMELKPAYWRQACRNLTEAERIGSRSLLDMMGAA